MNAQSEDKYLSAFIRCGYLEGGQGRMYLFIRNVPVEEKYPRKVDCIALDLETVSDRESEELISYQKPGIAWIDWRDSFLPALKETSIWLLEVKPSLNRSNPRLTYVEYEALGQILCYRFLFRRKYPSTNIKGLGIIGSYITEEFQEICSDYDISSFLIEVST